MTPNDMRNYLRRMGIATPERYIPMTSKATSLNSLIDAIPACTDGKKAIRALVAYMTGEVLEKEEPTSRIGDRFKYKHAEYILSVAESGESPKVVAINLGSGSRRGVEPTPVRNLYRITNEELKRIFRASYMHHITKIAASTITDSEMPRPARGF